MARRFIVLVNDYTRLIWVNLLKSKTEIPNVIKYFFSMITNQFGVSIRHFRSENAKDYFNIDLASFFRDLDIIRESSSVNILQQNRLIKRNIGHLMKITTALLTHQHVPIYLWGALVLIATYLSNQILISRVLGYESPINLIFKTF